MTAGNINHIKKQEFDDLSHAREFFESITFESEETGYAKILYRNGKLFKKVGNDS
tara:strand:- start:208 stop:372 length:165 start_codon:yes stop_codon:yes gene_type:complete